MKVYLVFEEYNLHGDTNINDVRYVCGSLIKAKRVLLDELDFHLTHGAFDNAELTDGNKIIDDSNLDIKELLRCDDSDFKFDAQSFYFWNGDKDDNEDYVKCWIEEYNVL